MKSTIVLIEDAGECYDPATTKAVPFYTYHGEDYAKEAVIASDAEAATLEELVWLCDQDAGNVNAHDYCGVHRLLGAVLIRDLGRTAATTVMRNIAYRRGLHGMNGLCGLQDSFKELNVGEAGCDWFGKYDG